MRRTRVAGLMVVALVAASCGDDSNGGGSAAPAPVIESTDDLVSTADPTVATTEPAAPPTQPPATTESPTTEPPTTEAPTTEPTDTGDDATDDTTPILTDADVRPGVEQITVTGAEPGTEIRLVDADDDSTDTTPVADGVIDAYGSLVFRGLDSDVSYQLANDDGATEPIDVLDRDEPPEQSFYDDQELPAPGYGYLETRDGTTLSINVALPGPVEDGPYPTVVEYSGYSPSNPEDGGFQNLFPPLGYAYVGVNIRGSGCSGGSFRFFEYAQSLDGYDVIETIAAQPWVQDHEVGMVGISYPGISQLFVAQTQPPSLAAITPVSVLDDSYRSTLYPGGILNTGFAVSWTQDRLDDGLPAIDPDGELTGDGQGYAAAQIESGDEECAANQSVRLQNPDLVGETRANEFYDPAIGDEIAPALFVDQIEVPTFLAGAWQDEQTGGRFPTMLDQFTGTDRFYASLVNGLHTESISPGIFPRYLAFLDLYVAKRTPSLDTATAVLPILAAGIYGTDDIGDPQNPYEGLEYDEALAAFEAEPPIQVLFEQGAADGSEPLTPLPRFVESFDAWPIPSTEPTTWYLGNDGTLLDQPETVDGVAEYLATPDGVPATFWEGNSSDLWQTGVVWDWQEPAPGTVSAFLSEPLAETLTMVGSASADLWVNSNLGDTDLEVTLTEVRPDGTEVMVQSGWLRGSHRGLDDVASTPLRPVQTHLESDASPLPDPDDPVAGEEEFALARVEIFPFAHVFREGSRLRLSVDAPGGNRAVWVFDTISNGEQVQIGLGPAFPSQLVLPVIPDVEPPAEYPECNSLKGQPCRFFTG